MRLYRLSDNEYIVRVRRFSQTRRLWGFALLLVGLGCAAGFLWCGHNLIQQYQELADSIAAIDQPTNEDMDVWADNEGFSTGFILGILLGVGTYCGITLAIFGFGLAVFRDRKTQMLLDCIDEHPTPQTGSKKSDTT